MPSIITQDPSASRRKTRLLIALTIFTGVVLMLWPLSSALTTVVERRAQGIITGFRMPEQHAQYENLRKKESIYEVLKESRIELEDAMEVAQALIDQSKETKIPISLFLAIMKKESNFKVHARSRRNAMGIMQIHPATWDSYVKKMNLDATRKDAFDPALNIRVSAAILSDLRAMYLKKGYREPALWDYVLSGYYAGAESTKRGLKRNHRHYVKKVRQFAGEMGSVI